MPSWVIAIAPALLAIAVLIWLVSRGHGIKTGKITLPFLELDVANFGDLAPVRLFSEISAICLPKNSYHAASVETKEMADKSPVILIHIGWNIVCESFVKRFHSYPDDACISTSAREIGGQNAEFVKMYRDIYTSAAANPRSVKRQFAADYLLRAPSLAERLEGKTPPLDRFVKEFLEIAEDEIRTSN